MNLQLSLALLFLINCLSFSYGFTNTPLNSRNGVRNPTVSLAAQKPGLFGGFFQELDNFMDDAFSRRLGNGAAFYGKRKSSFYGDDDKNKKADADMPDPTEDFQVTSSGNYKWKYDEETGQLKPVSIMKGVDVGRNPNYWDKVYAKQAVEDE